MKVCLLFICLTFSRKMECLLCSSNFKNQEDLLNHYISYHNVDENNCFFQKLFQIKNKSLLKHCVRCNEFLTTEKQKSIHNFLKHYEEGKSILFEDKPVDIVNYPGLLIYSIEFKKYKDFYDFFNSERCLDDFLRNAKYMFKPSGEKWIECSFTIENIQNFPHQDLRPITNSRLSTTPPYEGIYFNDFVFYSLRQNMLGRVIINGISGSLWHFKPFVSLLLKILDNYVEAVI